MSYSLHRTRLQYHHARMVVRSACECGWTGRDWDLLPNKALAIDEAVEDGAMHSEGEQE